MWGTGKEEMLRVGNAGFTIKVFRSRFQILSGFILFGPMSLTTASTAMPAFYSTVIISHKIGVLMIVSNS
jgi:hypothetical protein